MADNPKDFRDPKVTSSNTTDSSGGIGKWIAIAVGVVLLLLLLAWLLGLFADDEVDATVPLESTDEETVIVPTD
jgi:hypothetical protein